MSNLPEQATLVYTRCVFFRHEDTTILEQQVNYFLNFAPLAKLHKVETNTSNDDVIVTLWFEAMPNAQGIEQIYDDALVMGKPQGSSLAEILEDEEEEY